MELRRQADAAVPPPGQDSPLAAMVCAGEVQAAMDKLGLIASSRGLGASWTVIGRATGQTGREAKRDAKRLKRRTRRAWYAQRDQED